MTIGNLAPVTAVTSANSIAAYQQAVTAKLKAEPPPKAPFQPAPALRPTIQDRVEIDQALLALRQF